MTQRLAETGQPFNGLPEGNQQWADRFTAIHIRGLGRDSQSRVVPVAVALNLAGVLGRTAEQNYRPDEQSRVVLLDVLGSTGNDRFSESAAAVGSILHKVYGFETAISHVALPEVKQLNLKTLAERASELETSLPSRTPLYVAALTLRATKHAKRLLGGTHPPLDSESLVALKGAIQACPEWQVRGLHGKVGGDGKRVGIGHRRSRTIYGS